MPKPFAGGGSPTIQLGTASKPLREHRAVLVRLECQIEELESQSVFGRTSTAGGGGGWTRQISTFPLKSSGGNQWRTVLKSRSTALRDG